MKAVGKYQISINGSDWEQEDNLVVDEGLNYILNTAFGSWQSDKFYIALFKGSATPQPDWKASNFSAVADEIVSETEGFVGDRLEWIPVDTTNLQINNRGFEVSIIMKTASSITVTGSALLTSNIRGSTNGKLISACKFSAPRVFQDGDEFRIGYYIELDDEDGV